MSLITKDNMNYISADTVFPLQEFNIVHVDNMQLIGLSKKTICDLKNYRYFDNSPGNDIFFFNEFKDGVLCNGYYTETFFRQVGANIKEIWRKLGSNVKFDYTTVFSKTFFKKMISSKTDYRLLWRS